MAALRRQYDILNCRKDLGTFDEWLTSPFDRGLAAGRAGLELLRAKILGGVAQEEIRRRAAQLARLFAGEAWREEQGQLYRTLETATNRWRALRLIEAQLGRGRRGRRAGTAAPVGTMG